jgi:DNA-directed RNA polymerase subunit RPC12/RpoP
MLPAGKNTSVYTTLTTEQRKDHASRIAAHLANKQAAHEVHARKYNAPYAQGVHYSTFGANTPDTAYSTVFVASCYNCGAQATHEQTTSNNGCIWCGAVYSIPLSQTQAVHEVNARCATIEAHRARIEDAHANATANGHTLYVMFDTSVPYATQSYHGSYKCTQCTACVSWSYNEETNTAQTGQTPATAQPCTPSADQIAQWLYTVATDNAHTMHKLDTSTTDTGKYVCTSCGVRVSWWNEAPDQTHDIIASRAILRTCNRTSNTPADIMYAHEVHAVCTRF